MEKQTSTQTKPKSSVRRGRGRPPKSFKGGKGGAAALPTKPKEMNAATERLPKIVKDAVRTARKTVGTKGGAALAGGAVGLVAGATLMGIAGMAANRKNKKVTKTAQHAADILNEQAHDLQDVLEGKKK